MRVLVVEDNEGLARHPATGLGEAQAVPATARYGVEVYAHHLRKAPVDRGADDKIQTIRGIGYVALQGGPEGI
jgi:DNA-binding response OmpR family regulator